MGEEGLPRSARNKSQQVTRRGSVETEGLPKREHREGVQLIPGLQGLLHTCPPPGLLPDLPASSLAHIPTVSFCHSPLLFREDLSKFLSPSIQDIWTSAPSISPVPSVHPRLQIRQIPDTFTNIPIHLTSTPLHVLFQPLKLPTLLGCQPPPHFSKFSLNVISFVYL